MVNIYIQNSKVDQFKDEGVDIVSSVLDVSDITKNTGDYSKTFTVPASRDNNILFKHWYNASIDNGFDARTKVEGRIDIDGIPFKIGKFRLYKVAVKKGVATSYTINFFGNLIDIKDTVGIDEISSLDLTRYDHSFNPSNVALGLSTQGLSSRDIVYTLQAKKRYFYNSNPLIGDFSESQINIAYDGAGTGVLWSDLRPSLRIIKLIEAVEDQYSSGTAEVDDLKITLTAGTTAGDCYLVLNNIGYLIPIASAGSSAIVVADTIRDYVDDNIPGFSSTGFDGTDQVRITADEKGFVGLTSFSEGENDFFSGLFVRAVKGKKVYENPIVFSRDFFGTTEFNELYMWLSPSEEKAPGIAVRKIDLRFGSFQYINPVTDIGQYTVTDEISFSIVLRVTPDTGFEDVDFKASILSDGVELAIVDSTTGLNGTYIVLTKNTILDKTYNITFQVSSENTFRFRTGVIQTKIEYLNVETFETGSAFETITPEFEVKRQIPEIKIIDFLKGLFNMFKLVIIPQDDGTLYVNTLQSYYNQGKRVDVTRYIDHEKTDIQRGEILSEIDIKFTESETYLASQFRVLNNRGFGDSNVELLDEQGKILDGDSLEMEIPFEQFVYERLADGLDGDRTNLQISTIADSEGLPVSTGVNLHYVSLESIGSFDFAFVDDQDVRSIWSAPVNTPSHQYTTVDPLYSTLFEAEFSNWDGVKIDNTLYKNHYESYITSIFNIKRRTFKYKAKLPVRIITTLQLNDVISIGSDDYRINSYSYNLLNGETMLELINGFDNILGYGYLIPDVINLDNNANTLSYNLPNASLYTIAKIATDFGTDWLTINASGDVFTISVTENFSFTRNAIITLVLSGKVSARIAIKQIGGFNTSFDNDIITFDDDKITWDNN